MAFETLIVDVEDHVGLIRLNRPEALNALNFQLLDELGEALAEMDASPRVRAIVVTGSDKAFAAGADVKDMAPKGFVEMFTEDRFTPETEAILSCRKPIIAAVEGPAAGAGFSLVLACDFVVAASDAKFVMAYVKVGLTPDGGGSYEIARMLPRQLASEILMEGKPVDPARLAHFGIVNRVVQPGHALTEALRIADNLAKESPNAVRGMKSLINHAGTATLTEHLAAERDSFVAALPAILDTAGRS